MPEESLNHLLTAGRRVMAARRRLPMSRAKLARAAGISERSLARLEAGEDVRLSTYLAITHHLSTRRSAHVDLTERVSLLSEVGQARVLALIDRFERSPGE